MTGTENRIKNYLTNSIPDFETPSGDGSGAKQAANAATSESDDILRRFVPAHVPESDRTADVAPQDFVATVREIVELARKARERNAALLVEIDDLRHQLAELQADIEKLQSEKAALKAAMNRPAPRSDLSAAIQDSAFFEGDEEENRPEFRMPADRMLPPLKEALS